MSAMLGIQNCVLNVSGRSTMETYDVSVSDAPGSAIASARRQQDNRVWKSERRDSEHKKNFSALSSHSWSGFDDFLSRCDETNPNAIPLCRGGAIANPSNRTDGASDKNFSSGA
jgi:hypothetical protein